MFWVKPAIYGTRQRTTNDFFTGKKRKKWPNIADSHFS